MLILPLLFLGQVLSAASAPATPTLESYLQKLGYGAIPLQRNKENKLFLTASLDSYRRTLTLDTGWSLTALDTTVARKFKTPQQWGVQLGDAILGTNSGTNLVLIREMQVGSSRFLNQPAATMALKARGFSFDGVLGGDFLRRNNAILDCAAKRLFVRGSALPSETQQKLARTLGNSGFRRIALKALSDLVFTCSAKINDTPLELLVDTGAVYTLVDEAAARRCGMLWGKTGGRLEGVRRGMATELQSGKPRAFEIGGVGMPIQGIDIGVGELEPWQIGGKESGIQGILGAELLARASAVIDYGSDTLWIVEAAEPAR